jgi:hypothetical protein
MAVNVDVAEVEAQLAALRTRRNTLLAQRALAYALSAILIAAALIVPLALRASMQLFAAASAAISLAALAAIAYCASRAWTGWLSLPATARFADASAALDDRLTTLIGTAPNHPASTLRPLLVAQLLSARRHWTVDALAPQRVARAVALVPAAATLFAAATFYARPPGTPKATSLRVDRAAPFPAGSMGEGRSEDTNADAPLFADPAGEQPDAAAADTIDGDRRTAAGANGAPDGDQPIGEGAGDGSALAAAPTDGAAGPLASLQDSIRQTFGGGPDGNASRSGAAPQGKSAGEGNSDGDRPGADSQAPGDAQSASARNQQPAPQPGEAANPDAAAGKNGGAHGSGRGGGSATTAGTMFGGAAQARGAAADAAPMAIKLSAISGVSPSQHEPQQHAADVPAAPTNASRTGGRLPDMATTQLADATIQKLDVGPEYEGVVRRLFARQ